MPPWTAAPPGRVPGGAAGFVLRFGRLPEREILSVFLTIIVLSDSGARFDVTGVEVGELPVVRELTDGEVHGTVVGLVGDPFVHQDRDQGDHLGNALCG